MNDAGRHAFDIVLAEALDRISRDQADVATVFKQFRFAGVKIVTLSEGEITELHVGLKGTMNALYLSQESRDGPACFPHQPQIHVDHPGCAGPADHR